MISRPGPASPSGQTLRKTPAQQVNISLSGLRTFLSLYRGACVPHLSSAAANYAAPISPKDNLHDINNVPRCVRRYVQ
jgi:hypothetical protein